MKKQSTNPRKEEVDRLIQDFQTTGSKAPERKLIKKYQKLVESIAWKYSKGGEHHEDIVQVGMVGLLGAIRRYDITLGKSFTSYLIPTVIGEIKHFLRDKTWSIHVPRRIRELGPKIKNAREELITDLQRIPSTKEIADYLNIETEKVLEAIELGQGYQALSIDSTIEPEGNSANLHEMIGRKEKGYEKVNKRLVLENAFKVLTEREKKIIQYIFLKNKSQKETGKLIGVSQMHVSRIQRTAIKKLREAVNG